MARGFRLVSALLFVLAAAAPLSPAAAGNVNSCIDSCFSNFRPPASCSTCTTLRDLCVKDCSKVGPSYGAIAYGRTSGAWGSSYQWESQAKAESVALENCKKHGDDCEVMVWFHDYCAAVAADDGAGAYWALGDGEGEAREKAQGKCVEAGGKNCEIEAAQCSR